MASHGRPGEKTYHQDYIARIRYENTLPPPPGAPKLLNIPIEGLEYYTSAAFASRLVRQQPLNIEADAELGMPIDLVGMPGIFDGDESSIQAPLATPPVHPKDKSLLKRLADLGKPKYAMGSHSFLRRTEYISTDARARQDANAGTSKINTKSPVSPRQRRQSDAAREDPLNIMRHVVKGFDLANPEDTYDGPDDSTHLKGAKPSQAEIEAWNNPRHPSKPGLKCIGQYPLKPDLEALPESGTFYTMRFQGQPTSNNDRHDPRIDLALLHPVEVGDDGYNYEFYLLDKSDDAKELKRKFESIESDDDDSTGFKYHYVRTYETVKQTQNFEQPYREVALALHDGGAGSRLDKGAYYYPIGMRTIMKPRRSRNLLSQAKYEDVDESRADEINLTLRAADEREIEKRRGLYNDLVPEVKVTNGVKVT